MSETASANRQCAVCPQFFTPRSDTARACSPRCAERFVKAQKKAAAADRRATRERLLKIKPLKQWADEAQVAFNRYVRLRDYARGCASCDKPAMWGGQWHASHFLSVGEFPALRFNLDNVAKSCSVCNHRRGGNLLGFEPRLRERIGQERLDWLRTQTQRPEFTVEYLRRLRRIFTKKGNRLEKRIAAMQDRQLLP